MPLRQITRGPSSRIRSPSASEVSLQRRAMSAGRRVFLVLGDTLRLSVAVVLRLHRRSSGQIRMPAEANV